MNKEFIPYEQALELKELGFDEESICYYDIQDSYKMKPTPMREEVNAFHFNSTSIMVAAPLYQQAFRWFREKYGLCGVPTPIAYEILDKNDEYHEWGCIKEVVVFDSYEEAELACLKKLIEIVKNKN